MNISTHTLTWSVTTTAEPDEPIEEISTHTLTWSVTFPSKTCVQEKANFNSHAHVERDQPFL